MNAPYWMLVATVLVVSSVAVHFERKAERAQIAAADAEHEAMKVETNCRAAVSVAERCDRALLTCQSWQVRVIYELAEFRQAITVGCQ